MCYILDRVCKSPVPDTCIINHDGRLVNCKSYRYKVGQQICPTLYDCSNIEPATTNSMKGQMSESHIAQTGPHTVWGKVRQKFIHITKTFLKTVSLPCWLNTPFVCLFCQHLWSLFVTFIACCVSCLALRFFMSRHPFK